MDLFHGQLKSQVKCKTCGHISARFDPFNFLSLPLPMDSYMHLEITGEQAARPPSGCCRRQPELIRGCVLLGPCSD